MARTKTPQLPLVQPSESREVCFAIILASLGHWVSLTELRRDLGSHSGSDPLASLAAVAPGWALEAESFEATRTSLEELRPPLILRWESGHFVVLEGREGSVWWINDPKGGARAIPDEDFEKRLPLPALKLRATDEFRPRGRAPSLGRSLGRLLRGTRATFVACGIAAVGLVLGNLALAGLLTYFVDRILVDRIPDRIPPFLIALGVVQGLRAICTYLQAQYSLRLESAVVLRLEVDCLQHIGALPTWETDVRAAGDLQQRLAMIRKFATSIIGPLASAPSNLATFFLFGGAIVVLPHALHRPRRRSD